MNSKDTKSSGELKKDVLHELKQVNNDLDRIQRRLTPGQIIDDALFHPVNRNPRVVFDHLKANPIGTTFLSLGTLLLMENESHMTYESSLKKKGADVIENARYQSFLLKGRVSEINGDLEEKINGAKEKIEGAVQETRSKISSAKEKITQRKKGFSEVTGEADLGAGGELGSSSLDELKQNVSGVKDKISSKTSSLASDFSEELRAVQSLDPMVFSALGAGLGVLTGMSLPVSEKEREIVDQKLQGKLSQLGTELEEAVNKSARVLKDEVLGKLTDIDVAPFRSRSGRDETSRQEGSTY